MAVIAALQVTQDFVLPLVDRLVQKHVGNEEEPAFGGFVTGTD